MTRTGAPPAQPAASLHHICKGYPGVRALQAVSLDIHYGEVHAIVGENGAGKSTLLKILSGQIRPDCGRVSVDGVELRPHTTMAARRHGIRVVPQDVVVVAGFTAGRNVTLGHERRWVSRQRLSADERGPAREAMRLAGLAMAPTTPVGPLPVPEKRLVQIAQGLYGSGKVLVLDEPTAVVSEADSRHLLDRLDVLRRQGMAILYVSHRLTEVTAIADRVTVLRDGCVVAELARHEITRDALIRQMTKLSRTPSRAAEGGPVGPRTPPAARSAHLRVEGLTAPPTLQSVSLTPRPGRVTGIVGVQGSGHGEFLHALAGLRPYGGRVVVDDQQLVPGSVASARRAGVRLVPGDRRRAAIAAGLSISDNVALSSSTSSRFGFRRLRAERAAASSYITGMAVRPAVTSTPAGALSGGNQQKVAIANALVADPVVLLLEEPTQGVDVTGKSEIRRLVRTLADSGRCVVIATSEFEEVPEYVDDIYVMRLGRLTGPVPPEKASYEHLLHAALP